MEYVLIFDHIQSNNVPMKSILKNNFPVIYRLLKSIRYGLIIIVYYIAFPFFFPLGCILIVFQRGLKLGYIRASRLGHFVGDIDIALTLLSRSPKCEKAKRVILVVEGKVCNDYALKLISRAKVDSVKIQVVSCYPLLLFVYFIERAKTLSCIHIKTYGLAEYYASVISSPVMLQPKPSEIRIVNDWLVKHGNFNLDKPCIFLHNRDSAFLPGLSYHSYRDFAPDVFIPIVRKYNKQFNFIRGGKCANNPLPLNIDGFIDLPFKPHSDLVDILSHEVSDFFYGADSGVNCVSAAFRKPIAGINYPATSYGFLRKVNGYALGFIPKRLIRKSTGKPIGLIEMYESGFVNLWDTEAYDAKGIVIIDNSDEEVLEFFDETLLLFNNGLDKSIISTPEQEEFWSIVSHYDPEARNDKAIIENCFIGTGFLKRNQYLYS